MTTPKPSRGDLKALSRIAGRELAASDLLARSEGRNLCFYFGGLTSDEIRQSTKFGVKCSYSALYGESPTSTQSQVLTRRLRRLEEAGLIQCVRNPDSPRRHLAMLTRQGHDWLEDNGIAPTKITIAIRPHPSIQASTLPSWLSQGFDRSTTDPTLQKETS